MAGMKWYQMEIDRWRNSTRVAEMTLAERGAYRELLDAQFMHPEGYLPNAPGIFWQFARCTPQEWEAIKDKVLAMFDVVEDGKCLSNATMREQWERARSICDARAESGSRGGQARAKQLLKQNDGKIQADIDTDKEKNINPSSDADASCSPGTTSSAELESAIITRVFGYYLNATDRNPATYRLTPSRRRLAATRLRDCLKLTKGDYEKSESLLRLAVDGMAASDWHMGRNPKTNGKTYFEWDKHLFKSYEAMEGWWNTPQRPKLLPVQPESSTVADDLRQRRAAATADRGIM